MYIRLLDVPPNIAVAVCTINETPYQTRSHFPVPSVESHESRGHSLIVLHKVLNALPSASVFDIDNLPLSFTDLHTYAAGVRVYLRLAPTMTNILHLRRLFQR